jgi:hypothetical protein
VHGGADMGRFILKTGKISVRAVPYEPHARLW